MAQINQLSRTRVPGGDDTVKNYGVTDIGAYLAVILDTTNTPGSGTPKGVTLPASDVGAYAFTITPLVAGKLGQVQTLGIAIGTASATIHIGDYLMTDSAGKVLPQTAGKYQIGQAQSEALTGENVLVRIATAKNA